MKKYRILRNNHSHRRSSETQQEVHFDSRHVLVFWALMDSRRFISIPCNIRTIVNDNKCWALSAHCLEVYQGNGEKDMQSYYCIRRINHYFPRVLLWWKLVGRTIYHALVQWHQRPVSRATMGGWLIYWYIKWKWTVSFQKHFYSLTWSLMYLSGVLILIKCQSVKIKWA